MKTEEVDFRDYHHIFTDHNQGNPEDEIKLGFESKFKSIVLPANKTTTFHFPLRPVGYEGTEPQAMDGMDISASNLVLDGAICGNSPYCSDKVYAKNAGYEWKDVWGNYHPVAMQNGEWLCAWLSGDTTDPENAIWVDRWYDPKIATRHEAIVLASSDKILDIPSKLKFRYGSQYMYDRIGNSDIKEFVDELSTWDTSGHGLLINIDYWAASGCQNSCEKTKDILKIRNNGCTDDMFFAKQVNKNHETDYGIKFNGNATVQVDSNEVIKHGNSAFSVMAFIGHDDWANARGCAIIDRGYHGGWQISCAPKPKNNLICVLGKESSASDSNVTIAIYNTDFELLSKRTLTEDSKVYKVFIDDEFYVWALQKNHVAKTDLNGNFVYRTALPSGPSGIDGSDNGCIFQMMGDDRYSGYGYARIGNAAQKKFDMTSMTFSDFPASDDTWKYGLNAYVGPTQWMEIYNGTAEIHTASDVSSTIDSGETIRKTEIDSDNNVYVLTDKKIYRYIKDRDATYLRRNAYTLPVEKHGVPVEIIPTTKFRNGKLETIINVVMRRGYVLSFTQKLVRLWSHNISGNSDWITSAVSNYEWSRRFCNNCLYTRILLGQSDEIDMNHGKKVYMKIPLSEVSNYDWHHVALVRNCDDNTIRFYLDETEKAKYQLSSSEKNYKVMSVGTPSIVLGGECGFGTQLYTEHRVSNTFWDGYMDDFRLYSFAIPKAELGYIHMQKYDIGDLSWNMEMANKYYVEAIKRVFKMKMPGSKSNNYKISITGYDGQKAAKDKISELVGDALPEVTPAYTKNVRISFDGEN